MIEPFTRCPRCNASAQIRQPDGSWKCTRCGGPRKAPRKPPTAQLVALTEDTLTISLPPTELGFVITPGEIADRIAAVDKAVQALAGDIVRSTHAKLNAQWRAEWSSFMRRWAVERDSYASWSARLFATRVIPRVEQYQASYNWWAADFQRRTAVAPTVPAAAPVTDFSASMIPTQVWWIVAGAAALWVISKRVA